MKNQINDLTEKYPKHFSAMIKRNTDLYNWVMKHSKIQSDNLSEMVFSALHQVDNICSNGKQKHFVSFFKGYSGCGPAGVCLCAREAISESVAKSKSNITREVQDQINDKRRATNLEKYGVICTGQLEHSKQKHKNFYADPVKVKENLDKIKKTYIDRYGVENCRHIPEVEQKRLATILTKYGVSNIAQIPSTKAKLSARIAEYKSSGFLIRKGYDRFKKHVYQKYAFTLTTPMDQYLGFTSKQVLQFKCNTCGTYIDKKFHYGRGLTCEVCHPKPPPAYISAEEQEVFDFITHELGISGKQSVKTIISPFELDMVFDQQKIAIEYCGLYWHSEHSSGKGQKYHYAKMMAANAAGYRLITIFSDEWNLHKEKVKSKLTHIFGVNSQRYHARKLLIAEIPQPTSKEFLNKHHLQGYGIAKINIGLIDSHTQNLVALMTFSNGRKALNTKIIDGEFELVRFATDGSAVIGGASKMLKYFINKYSPTKITSYADLRWSEGKVYETIGFTKNTKPTIGYWYVDSYIRRDHRYNFRKSELVNEGADSNLTEWEIMLELGYDRIWDCGHQKYTMVL